MGDFKQRGDKRFGGGHGGGFGGRDGGRPNFSRKNWGGSGGGDRGSVTMHPATCAQCGKPCEVPFRPTEGKPVYCRDCFGGKKEAGHTTGGDRFPQKVFSNYQAPVRADLEIGASKGCCDEAKRQLESLNAKMDRLIRAVEVIAGAKTPAIEEKAEGIAKVAPAVKTVVAKKSAKKVSKK